MSAGGGQEEGHQPEDHKQVPGRDQGDAGQGRQVPSRDDGHEVHKAGGVALDDKVQGVGAGMEDEEQGEGAGQDGRVQDEGVGLDENVQGADKAKTEDTEDKAGTNPITNPKAEDEDAKNGNIPAKPKKRGKEDTTERAMIHKVRTKDKEEAIKNGNGCKRPIFMDREGKINDNKWSKTEAEWSRTEARREARDGNKVQELRDTREEDNNQDVPEVLSRPTENRRIHSDNGDPYPPADPRCHQGAVRPWLPGMDSAVERRGSTCPPCQASEESKARDPRKPTMTASTRPGTRPATEAKTTATASATSRPATAARARTSVMTPVTSNRPGPRPAMRGMAWTRVRTRARAISTRTRPRVPTRRISPMRRRWPRSDGYSMRRARPNSRPC